MQLKKIKNLNFFKEKSLNNLIRVLLSSFLMISFFYITPIFLNFTQKNLHNEEFTNTSKQILAYTLNNGSKNQDDNINENDVLFDIFSLNDLETDSVRLSASTIKQLFEDTGYNLKDVRKKKLVKPVALTLLPQEIKMIESTKKRKEFFIQIVLPLIIQENNNIRLDRKTLFDIINKSNNTISEKSGLKKNINSMG